jgi:hypothetical protein
MAGPANPQNTQATQNTQASAAAPNVYQQSSDAYAGALGATGAAMAGPQINRFMNPYTQSVTNQALADLERQRQMQGMGTAAQAHQAGAFGGSRHGVADALTNEAFARQAAQTAANLNMQGFNTALGAAQNQQNLMMRGGAQLGNLTNLGFGIGQQVAGQQAQQGAMQQALSQQLIDAAQNQYSGFTGAPQQALTLPMASVGAANMGQQTQTTQQNPGLLGTLGTIFGVLAGF